MDKIASVFLLLLIAALAQAEPTLGAPRYTPLS